MVAEKKAALKERSRPVLVKYRSSNTYVLLTASFSMFTGMVIYGIIIPLTPFILDAMHQGTSPDKLIGESGEYSSQESEVTSREAGILFALYSISCGIGSPIFGYIGDKMTHRKLPMLGGIVTLFGSTFIFLFAAQFWMLALARVLQGLSDACVWTLSLVLVSDTFPESVIGTQTSRVMMFHLIGSSAGVPIGALYHTMGYKAPFVFCIILAGVDFILRLLLVERRNNPKHWFETSNTDTSLEEASTRSMAPPANTKSNLGPEEIISIYSNDDDNQSISMRKTLRSVNIMKMLLHPRVLAAILVALIHGFYTGVLEPALPMHLANEFGYNSADIGLIYLAQILPSFVATPLSGYLYDKYGSKYLCSSMLLLAGVAMALMGIPSTSTAGGPIPLIVLTAIFGFSSSMVMPPVFPELSNAMTMLSGNNHDDISGRSYSIGNVGYCIGNLTGPLFAGYLLNVIGFFWICITVACMMLTIAPLVLIYSGEKTITLSDTSKILK